MQLRPYVEQDFEAVAHLNALAHAEVGVSVPDTFFSDLDDIESNYAGGIFLVMEDQGVIVGMGGLRSSGEIVRMRVHPSYQRRGIGTKILEALIQHAQNIGHSFVYLKTLESQAKARSLYERAEFVLMKYTIEGGNHIVIYQKNI